MLLKAIIASGLMTVFGVVNSTAQQAPPAQQQPQGQTDISDEKLDQFVVVLGEVNEIQQGMQEEMITVVEEQGLDVNKFNEIAQQQQNPNADDSNITAEEKAAFEKAMEDVQQMQMEMQQRMEAKIVENDMDMNEFNQLMQAYQQDPEMQQKVNEKMQQR